MKSIIFYLIVAFSLLSNAQERQSLSMDYEKGTLTFEYYPKDGIKIPDGKMKYVRNSNNDYGMKTTYQESGNNKDGYKEGEWKIEASTPGRIFEIIIDYKNGLIDGEFVFKEYDVNSKKIKRELKKEQKFNFENGHLVGEQVFFYNSDTLYFNYDKEGKRVGEWRLCKPNFNTKVGTFVYEGEDEYSYTNRSKYDVKNTYEIDILGQKIPKDDSFNSFSMDIALPLIFLKEFLMGDPTYIRRHNRVALPTLHENKFGMTNDF